MPPPIYPVPLDQPPHVVSMGRHAHGFVPCDRYRLNDLWSLHLYGYDAVLRLDGEEVPIRRGTLGVTPPGTLVETRYFGISVHLYAHFILKPGPLTPVVALTDVGSAYDALYEELYDAVGRFEREPTCATARVWNALWRAASLSGSPTANDDPAHPVVRRVSERIEKRLAERLSVEDLARSAEVSPCYLTRLFREAYGETVVGHIQRRRMERASDLLLRSTLPIKVVASSVGIGDLQRFNKAIRAHFGVSPREWRSRGAATMAPETQRPLVPSPVPPMPSPLNCV